MVDSEGETEEARDPEPIVYAIKRHGSVWKLDRRDTLKSIAVGAVSAMTINCAKPPSEHAARPALLVNVQRGGYTFLMLDLRERQESLPSSGRGRIFLANTDTGLHFRAFDESGKLAVDAGEVHFSSAAADIQQLKILVAAIIEANTASQDQQIEMTVLVRRILETSGAVALGPRERRSLPIVGQEDRSADPPRVAPTTDSSAGRRLQAAAAPPAQSADLATGRRMQASSAPTDDELLAHQRLQGSVGPPLGVGTTATRARLQGAPGRRVTRNLGTITVEGTSYKGARVVAVYTDGTLRIAHEKGVTVLRVESLPVSLRGSLPDPVPKPPSSPPAPHPPPPPPPAYHPPAYPGPPKTYSYHYWRPN